MGSFLFQYSEGSRFEYAETAEAVQGILLGEVVNPARPELSNAGLLSDMLERFWLGAESALLDYLCQCSGDFLLICLHGDRLYCFADACGQFEAFYDFDKCILTNNPRLLPHFEAEPDALLQKYMLCIYQYTGQPGLLKLRPNHYLDFAKAAHIRYFPSAEMPVEPVDFQAAVEGIAGIMRGTLEAFARRQRTVLALTAGYDSRLLLAAGAGLALETFTYCHAHMPEDHSDIAIGRQLAAAAAMPYGVYQYREHVAEDKLLHFQKLYMPRMEQAARVLEGDGIHFADALMLNGNMGEIGRSYYGVNDAANPRELAAMIGHRGRAEVISLMDEWRAGLDLQYTGKGNLLDLFYWEERMGNWAAKAKTEMRIATRLVSPMNNFALWRQVLGVKHAYRSTVSNKLFLAVIKALDARLLQYPINPGRKTALMRAMVKTGIYTPYKRWYWKMKSA